MFIITILQKINLIKYKKMRVIKTKVYQIHEHPGKELCFKWIRENFHDLNEFSVYELVDSIKKLSQEIGGTNDYSISQSPCRGEYINFSEYDQLALDSLEADKCELTGTFWDQEIIKGLKSNSLNNVLQQLHQETEYVYSDEGLTDLCEANEYEFTENGSLIYN